jgi:polar amino acid transport system ATP-binding protein
MVGEVLSLMRELAKEGMTMVVVTHEIGFAAEIADRIIFMDQGSILLEGKAQDVINNKENPRVRDFFAKVL